MKTTSSTHLKMCPYSELFWSAFFHIRTEFGLFRVTPNTDTFHTVVTFSTFSIRKYRYIEDAIIKRHDDIIVTKYNLQYIQRSKHVFLVVELESIT